MHKIYTAADAQRTDEHTIKTIGIPSLVLMERAALGVTKRVLTLLKGDRSHPVICVCGKGNNGADGMAVARQLMEHGVNVSVYLCGTQMPSKISKNASDYEVQLSICLNTGMKFLKSLTLPKGAVVVDAVFGNGLDREIGGIYKDIIKKINAAGAYVIAIDIPSGINATSGQFMGIAVKADETVTFGSERLGHLLYPGADYTGSLKVENIGWQREGLKEDEMNCYALDSEELKLIPGRKSNSHKGSFGKALIIAGSKEYGGAALLSAKAAFAAGAGLVRLYTHKENRTPVLSVLPETIVTAYEKSDFQPEKIGESITGLDALIKNADVIAIGSGIGKNEISAQILKNVLSKATCTLILDADALNLIADGRVELKKRKDADIIITPHLKEAARLLDLDVRELEEDLPGACRRLYEKYRANVILKSAVTLITDGKDIFVNKGGNSGMACAGSGDVLTGILAGLGAQGLRGAELAVTGVYLHSAAGEHARESFGEYGMRPSDIADSVGDVLKSGLLL